MYLCVMKEMILSIFKLNLLKNSRDFFSLMTYQGKFMSNFQDKFVSTNGEHLCTFDNTFGKG